LLCAHAALADLAVATSGTFTAAYLALAPQLEQIAHDKVVTAATSIGSGADSIPNRVKRGEAIDLVIASDGRRPPARRRRPRGGGQPHRACALRYRDRRAQRRTAARHLERRRAPGRAAPRELDRYSGSVSGTYVSTKLFAALGVEAEVAPKSRRIDTERVGAVVARGDAEIGFQQLSELKPIDGIDIVGPLPAEVQYVSVFLGPALSRDRRTRTPRAR
jgi:molybdate transport system substrate-binding protein